MADWDYDGKRILGHIGFDIYIWDAQTGKVLQKFVGHRDWIISLQFSPDGKYVLSSSGVYQVGDFIPDCGQKDTSTRLWDAETGNEIWRLEGQAAAAFNPDGKRLLTFSILRPCTNAAGISMWDVASGKKLYDAKSVVSIARGGLPVSVFYAHVAFSPDWHTFFVEQNPSATLYDAENGREIGRIDMVYSFNFYGDGGEIATYGLRGGIEIWNSKVQRIRDIPPINEYASGAGVWNEDGTRFVYIDGCNKKRSDKSLPSCLQVWDVNSGKIPTQNVPTTRNLLIHPDDKRYLLSWGSKRGDMNENIHPVHLAMYDLNSGKQLWETQTESGKVLGFSTDGKTFLVGGQSFTVYSSDSGKAQATFDLLGEHWRDGFGP